MSKFKRIGDTILPDGKRVSTVRLDWDHPLVGGLEPFMDLPSWDYETMVFPTESARARELDVVRYQTEAEAISGHAAMVEKWSKRKAEDTP